MSKVVVTGAAGFIGSHLCERLLAEGHEVVGIDSFTDYYERSVKEANIADAICHARYRLIEADILELGVASLTSLFADASCVYHLAAQAGVRASWGENFRAYTDANMLGTQVVLEAIRVGGTQAPRLVFASSSSVYGKSSDLPYREDGECRPVSPYGVTKLAGERLCDLYSTAFGVRTVVMRFFTVYGPRQRPDMAFHIFARALLEGAPLPVFGGGDQTRDFTFVTDIVAALLVAPDAPAGSVINVGGGERATLNQAIAILELLTGQRGQREDGPAQTGDMRDTWADITRARSLLGDQPRVALSEGLAAEVAWMRGARGR